MNVSLVVLALFSLYGTDKKNFLPDIQGSYHVYLTGGLYNLIFKAEVLELSSMFGQKNAISKSNIVSGEEKCSNLLPVHTHYTEQMNMMNIK